MHDLQRHVKRWCSENFPLKRERDVKRKRDDENDEDQPLTKKILITPEEKEKEREDQEHEVFNYLMKRAKEYNEKQWDQKYNKYVKEGLSRNDAMVKAEDKMNSKDLIRFSENYELIIVFIRRLKNRPNHSEIMRDVKNVLSDGYNEQAIVKMALNKNCHLLKEG